MTKRANTIRAAGSGATTTPWVLAAGIVATAFFFAWLGLAETVFAQRSADSRSGERPAARKTETAAPAGSRKALTPAHLGKLDDFRLLLDRNIFDRYRRAPVVRESRSPETRPTRPVATATPKPTDTDESFVLLGIGLEAEQYTAFFEDTREGKILTVQPGQTVGKGKLLAVNMNSVHYERGEIRRVVKIGHTLTGSRAATGEFATATGSASSSPAAPLAPGPP